MTEKTVIIIIIIIIIIIHAKDKLHMMHVAGD